MKSAVTIAVDLMGGDHGPEVTIPGAAIALERHQAARFVLVGDEAKARALLDAHPKLKAASTFVHTDVAVRMDDKPSQALRTGRYKSSMWMALDAVKAGRADAAVSAGNTGALMAMARFSIKMMSGIERPAIAAIWPTLRGESIVLDVGATIGAEAQQLVDNAVMGAAMGRALFEIEHPTVGLLNIGVEEVKGLEEVRAAGRILRDMDLPGLVYDGFVEGDDLGRGTVDVVVTEGFAGNIALKTAEGTARQIAELLKLTMSRTLTAKIGYLLTRSGFAALRERLQPRSAGGVFLGLNGVVIKSHGGTDADGFAGAVDLGYDMVRNELLGKIRADLEHYRGGRSAGEPVAEGAQIS